MIKRIKWTKQEEQFLIDNYDKLTNKEIAKILGRRNKNIIQNKAQKMGITKKIRKIYGNSKPWTKNDDDVVRNYYGKMPAGNIGNKLGRSVSSIHHRGNILGLRGYIKKGPREALRKTAYYLWKQITIEIKNRDGGKCVLCGYSKHTHVHHIISNQDGGSDKPSNLITLCPNHHAEADAGEIPQNKLRDFVVL